MDSSLLSSAQGRDPVAGAGGAATRAAGAATGVGPRHKTAITLHFLSENRAP